jgi:pyruvate/2-oxoglutarate dehydrogenase complex dihydrolipoamide dehydrogenase (E3) component
MAQAMRRFGSRVTVIERNDALAHREDPDVSEALKGLFDDEGIEVFTGTRVDRVEGHSGESVRLHATSNGVEVVIEGSDILVTSGRTPNTDGIGLEAAGIERDDRGFVKVDERCRTTAPGVWAVGDCAGSHISRTSPMTTSAWSATTSPASTIRRPIVSCLSVCSPNLSWPGSA